MSCRLLQWLITTLKTTICLGPSPILWLKHELIFQTTLKCQFCGNSRWGCDFLGFAVDELLHHCQADKQMLTQRHCSSGLRVEPVIVAHQRSMCRNEILIITSEAMSAWPCCLLLYTVDVLSCSGYFNYGNLFLAVKRCLFTKPSKTQWKVTKKLINFHRGCDFSN